MEKTSQKKFKAVSAPKGEVRCHACGRCLGKAYYGAEVHGFEIRCRCGAFTLIELNKGK